MALNPEISRQGIDTRPRIRKILSKRKGLAATALLAGTAVVGSMAIGEYVWGDPMILPQYGYDSVTQKPCPALDTSALLEAGRLVAQIPEQPKGLGVVGYDKYQQKQNDKYGMTLVETQPYYSALTNATTKDEAALVMHDYLSNYGLNFEIPTETDVKDIEAAVEGFSVHPVDLDLIDTQEFIRATQKYLFNMSNIPVEIVKAAGVEELRLMSSPESVKKDDGTLGKEFAGLYTGLSKRIYIDIDDWMRGFSQSLVHEIGHGLDHEFCGTTGSFYDPEFASINPPDFKYGVTIDDTKTITTSEYGSTKISEDKAETIVPILSIPEALFYFDQTIKDKFAILLARLDTLVPGSLKYYVSLAKRTNSSPKS